MICTGHGSHADLVLKGLKSGKNVYVEKPLCTTLEQLEAIKAYYTGESVKDKPCLMVGFNRRFSKYATEIKRVLDKRSAPALIHYRMNAGFAPADVWVHNDGGRIIGEGCHMIDLMQYLIGAEVTACSVSSFRPKNGMYLSEDNRSISMEFSDGSVAVIDYFSCGSKELPKEFMEIHFEGKTIIMDDYMKLTGFGVKIKEMRESAPKKGHKEEWLSMYDSLRKGENPIPLDSIFKTTELSILSAQE
jgi:predicted dehydrogenase